MTELRENIPIDMRQAVEACDVRCEAILEEHLQKVEAQKTPSVIYHYTDEAGFLGILKSRRIRLTDMFGLNDPSELQYGLIHACEVLEEQSTTAHPAAAVFSKKFREVVGAKFCKVAHFFVACFSKSQDDLGQWRAYGNDGKGFALGFDGTLLENAFVQPGKESARGNATFHVNYDDSLLRSLHRQLVKEVLSLIGLPKGRDLNNMIINEFMKELSVVLGLHAIRASIFFKHKAYKNEEEFRFLQLRELNGSLEDLKQRVRNYSFIRFAEFDWMSKNQSVLREIFIGPAADQVAAKLFVQNCLRDNGFDEEKITIKCSTIPYRNA